MASPEDGVTPGRTVRVLLWLRPIISLLIVNALALFGQVLYGFDNYSPDTWPPAARLTVAITAGCAAESMGLYVQWHAHDALLRNATATAARMRRYSYLIAAGVAALNYSHFAGPHWSPTPAAVLFAACSLASPWLWGLHSRRARGLQLLREGHADVTGAVFAAERWRMFPIRTWCALRYSIEYSITDARTAWESYHADPMTTRARRRVISQPGDTPAKAAAPATGDNAKPAEQATQPVLRGLPSPRRGRRHTPANGRGITDEAALANAHRWMAARQGRLPRTRAELREATGTGGARADRLGEQLHAEHEARTGTEGPR